MLAKDRLPAVSLRGEFVYNFWQDEAHERGLWRRTSLAEFKKSQPKWEILLDLDRLAKQENENWVWKGANCLSKKDHMCMLQLSRGGKDAVVIREYDLQTRSFVAGGFSLPESKGRTNWLDENTLLITTDFGPGTMTSSGYPRQLRRWTRGQKYQDAKLIQEVKPEDMSVYGWVSETPTRTWTLAGRQITFYTSELSLITPDGALTRLPIPEHADAQVIFQDQLLFTLRHPWKTPTAEFRPGQLLAISLKDLDAPPTIVYSAPKNVFLQYAAATSSAVFLGVLEKVQGRILRIERTSKNIWSATEALGTGQGHLEIQSADPMSPILLAQHEGFLSPPAVWSLDSSKPQTKFVKLKSLPSRFQGKNLKSEQFEATSRDGTKIPYFVILPKNLKLNSNNPAILYGYGGFEHSLTPSYMGATGKVWLEKLGGVYVIANIRGGGEFGPAWHTAALKENRQKAYDDFIAVAEDLIARKITSPKKLAIMGGSNGGLLVGAALTQRPDLFQAVVCQVPLLDMLRYHKLLAGHSWMAEYGDPEDAKMREVILKYSPYQNLHADKTYPEVFFMTSTKDDRVHPGHARKMAARMMEMKKPVLFFENIEGGHGASANLEQKVKFTTLTLSFLKEKLTE
jgi:prolyl oligopeptidase